MKKKNVLWGLVMVLLAVYMIISGLGYLPEVSFFTGIFTIIFGYSVIRGVIKKSFFQTIMSLAILGCLYSRPLQIEAITPWILLGAAILLSIGLEILFKNRTVHVYARPGKVEFGAYKTSDFVDGDYVRCENQFGTTAKYVNSEHFAQADIENHFGSLNVYFDNAIMGNFSASVKVENNFGETNLYFPATWRIECRQNCAFGSVIMKGHGSENTDAPLVRLDAEANFGAVNVYFN